MSALREAPLLVKAALALAAAMIAAAVFAGLLAPHDIAMVDLGNRVQPPVFMGGTWSHPLGTDNLGRDVLSLVLRGLQVSLAVACFGTLGGAVIGASLGFAAAWIGGWFDEILGVAIDFQATIPNLILALALLTIFPQANLGLFLAVMCIIGWERYARLARAIGLAAKSQSYVQAQIVIGASPMRIIAKTVLPNAMAVLLVNLSINFPQLIITETTLSFLGVGIQPPDTSLGLLIDQGRNQLYRAPWVALAPGIAIMAATISISIIGDWLRDLVERD